MPCTRGTLRERGHRDGALPRNSDDPLVPLLSAFAVFAVFAVGSLLRPLGGLLLGSLADRIGRRNALTVTISMMGAGSLVLIPFALGAVLAAVGFWIRRGAEETQTAAGAEPAQALAVGTLALAFFAVLQPWAASCSTGSGAGPCRYRMLRRRTSCRWA